MSDASQVPKSCQSLTERIRTLEWAQVALKKIPNLPKGKARDLLEIDVNAIVNESPTSFLQVENLLDEFTKTLSQFLDLTSQVKGYRRPSPTEVDQLQSNARQMKDDVKRLKDSLSFSITRSSGR